MSILGQILNEYLNNRGIYFIDLILNPEYKQRKICFQCVKVHIYSSCIHVCTRVSDSVEKNRRQLQRITDRIRLAQARVDKIKGSKKATKVRQRRQLCTPKL